MHILKSIEISKFRGQARPIKLDLNPQANFLIGRNGTGKTTLINLIKSALQFDVDQLTTANFDTITLKFKSESGAKVPMVTVKKVDDEFGKDIEYIIYDSVSSEGVSHRFADGPNQVRAVTKDGKTVLVRRPSSPKKPLRQTLRDLYQFTWLSLQRRDVLSSESFDFEDYDNEKNDIDQKLDEILISVGQFFSRLDSIVSDETQIFQRKWFLSFLASERSTNLYKINELDNAHERETLDSIFLRFFTNSDEYETLLDKHFILLEQSKEKFKGSNLLVDDAIVLSDTLRLHSLVEQWQMLQDRQLEVYKPKTEFSKILTEMFYNKVVEIARNNTLMIRSYRNDIVPIHSLSSGEKQLLIFLSETLLQSNNSYIFLADEPELSLHVEWQEDLVPSILALNPNAQILFATHSPDIVNKYQNCVFRMEDLIQ